MPSVKDDIQLFQSLEQSTHYQNYRTMVDAVNSLFLPRRSNILTEKTPGSLEWTQKIFEAHPMMAVRTLAMGQFDLLFTGDWFDAQPPDDGVDDLRRSKAYDVASRRMMKAIQGSNFRLEVQEFLVDRSAPHTGLMLVEDIDGKIVHTHVPVASYVLADNYNGYVDTVVRWFKLSARQAKQMFNKEKDVLPEKVRKACEKPATESTEFKFFHTIQRNYDRNPNSPLSKDKPWSSRYRMEDDDKTMIRESGYDEQPFVVSRFDRWGDKSPYGFGPSFIGIYPARGLQVMGRDMQAAGSLASRPRYFTISDEVIDPNEDTVVTPEEASMGYPKPKVENHQFQISEHVFELMKRQIDDLFYVSGIQLLTSDIEQKREKTAYEVSKMLDEKIGQMGPTFARLEQEALVPYLTRIFGIMLRQGKFNDLLQDMGAEMLGNGQVNVPDPEIVFTSKLAMMMRLVQSNAFRAFLIENQFIAEIAPDVMSRKFDWYAWLEESWKNNGLPEKFIRDQRDIEAEIEQEQKIQATAMALQGGQAVADISQKMAK